MSLREIERMTVRLPNTTIAQEIVTGRVLCIRDVANSQQAFHYSSGNFGPGYITIKGACSNQRLFKFLVRQLALKILEIGIRPDFIAGLVTGGVPPSLYLRDYLQELMDYELPWVYIRDTRKAGGTREHVTGIVYIDNNEPVEEIPIGCTGVVMEELVNYANSISNGAGVLRNSGYVCNVGFTILNYDHAKNREALHEAKLNLISLLTLPELLDAVEEAKAYPKHVIDDYRWFLQDTAGWMSHYGYERKEHGR